MLDQAGSEKAEILSRAAEAAAPRDGSAALKALLDTYYRGVPAADLAPRDPLDVANAAIAHRAFAELRNTGEAKVRVSHQPARERARPSTAVEIVTDDMPFLVESVATELSRTGRAIHLVVHPQVVVRRDRDGRIEGVVEPLGAAAPAPPGVAESWMRFEIADESDVEARERLGRGVDGVLHDVRAAVRDWQDMRQAAIDVADELCRVQSAAEREEREEARELLRWLADDHFTFLGSRAYAREEADGRDVLRAMHGTGLGVLADDDAAVEILPRARTGDRRPLVLSKSGVRSRVHRRAHLDVVAVRRDGRDGIPVAELRFVGLFTSAVYAESIDRVPVLRTKAREVLRRCGLPRTSHSGRDLVEILETYPRDDLFQISVDDLVDVASGVLGLQERRQLRLFLRRDDEGRFMSCLVYFPRDQYTTDARLRLERILKDTFSGDSVEYSARVSESVLARLHFVVWVEAGDIVADVDAAALEARLAAAVRSWEDDLAGALGSVYDEPERARLLVRYVDSFPEAYKENCPASTALTDIARLEGLGGEGELATHLYVPPPDLPGDRRLKIYRAGSAISLSQILPVLERMMVEVVDERPYEVRRGDGSSLWIYDFGLRYELPLGVSETTGATLMEAAVAAVWSGDAESDGFNALVPHAGLSWRQAMVMRSYGRVLRQAGSTFGQAYVEWCLVANVPVARHLIRLFETRFDPSLGGDRSEGQRELERELAVMLDAVESLDQDRILRSFLGLVQATDRTNYYQGTPERPPPYLVLKLDPQRIDDLPRPRPRHEVWVQSPRVEAVHLRFGPVARGGLRWSDRREDLRTEVLDLAKTQAVKNAVIVPVGAKGGFVVKRPPADAAAAAAEGAACYREFIGGMLDVTDNVADGRVVGPAGVIRHDGDDPYLVVAADKGTATFSDIANAVSAEHAFWLGDAFASGGSSGYDHKAMGITARGAWVSVERHLRDLGVDPGAHPFTAVGIGDMSGDVFGNGMLLSRGIRLVAAFDHRHVFLDPDPAPEAAFEERRRLFALPGSSWADYDASLISPGGGVVARSAKAVRVSPEAARALGMDEPRMPVTPSELIKAILRAPVDLLWNGGIGTFVKSTAERHAEVGDKVNDGVRVDGSELRCRCVGEGGNLGFTQLARVEYALGGGRINTDAIDNSAGVDTSDHEVNIKILLERVARSGGMARADRDGLLDEMAAEVVEQVLRDNHDQNVSLSHSATQGPNLLHVHARMIRGLERQGSLDREVESLPSAKQIAERRQEGQGLVGPELAVLLAYAKIVLADELLASELPDEDAFVDALTGYFPALLQARFPEQIAEHPLRRQIVATVVANRVVNRGGISFWWRLRDELGAMPAEIARAHTAAWEIFGMADRWAEIGGLPASVAASTRVEMRLEGERLVERGTRWLLTYRWAWRDSAAAVFMFREGVREVVSQLPALLRGGDAEAFDERRLRWLEASVPRSLAAAVAGMEASYGVLDVVEVATERGRPVLDVAEPHFALAERLGVGRLLGRIDALPRDDRWRTLARASLREDLFAAHAQLTAHVVDQAAEGTGVERVGAWVERHRPAVDHALAAIDEIAATNVVDMATMSVATRALRGLVRAVTGAHF